MKTPIQQRFCQLSGNKNNVVYYRERFVFEWKFIFKTTELCLWVDYLDRQREGHRQSERDTQLDDDNITSFLRIAHISRRHVFIFVCNYLLVNSSNMIKVTYKNDSERKRARFSTLMIQIITQLPKSVIFADNSCNLYN